MKHLTILFLAIGLFSCVENKKTDSQADTQPEIETNSELNGFNLIGNFESNRKKFNSDTIEIVDHSTDGGELIVYHDNEFKCVVLDFWLYGEMGKLNYTYWTNNDFKIKRVKKTDYEYDKPYYEDGFKIDSTTQYLMYSRSNSRLFDSDKNEIKDRKIVDSTKNHWEEFYNDISQEIEIIK